MAAFVLVHSPLVGSFTWSLVAEEMRNRDIPALRPALPDSRELRPPYWEKHAQAIADAMQQLPPDESVVLAGHSGGGMLLPAIREESSRPVAAYIFVDATIPQNGRSRLDLFDQEAAERFRARAVDGLLPTWTEQDLAQALPDPIVRHRFVQELTPLPLAVYDEAIPVALAWPDAPCCYLQFTPTYRSEADNAQRHGWPCIKLDGGHFLMLINPNVVTNSLLSLTAQLGIASP
jgi:pimeloyl-ACP methyl ester carboxylesterase